MLRAQYAFSKRNIVRLYLNIEKENTTKSQVLSDIKLNRPPKQESSEDNEKMRFSPEEIENSKRIFKSATPKYTIDWYVKWASSIILICAISIRSAQISPFMDLILSFTGMVGWTYVSLVWKDRALILVNGIAMVLLGTGLLRHFAG